MRPWQQVVKYNEQKFVSMLRAHENLWSPSKPCVIPVAAFRFKLVELRKQVFGKGMPTAHARFEPRMLNSS